MDMAQEKRKFANRQGIFPGVNRQCLHCPDIIPWHANGKYCQHCCSELDLPYSANNDVAEKFNDLWGWEALVE